MEHRDYEELKTALVQQAAERGRPTHDEWAFELWWLLSSQDKVHPEVAERLYTACGYQPAGKFPLARLT